MLATSHTDMMSYDCGKADTGLSAHCHRISKCRFRSQLASHLPGRATTARAGSAGVTFAHTRDSYREGAGEDCPVGSSGRTGKLTKHDDLW
jgi:hypothetical protein